MTTYESVREIDTGAAMARFARGWHCLSLADSFRDGQPHGITVFGTMLVVFADSQGVLRVWMGTADTWAATCRRAPSRAGS